MKKKKPRKNIQIRDGLRVRRNWGVEIQSKEPGSRPGVIYVDVADVPALVAALSEIAQHDEAVPVKQTTA